jgi:hypothetical protein
MGKFAAPSISPPRRKEMEKQEAKKSNKIDLNIIE